MNNNSGLGINLNNNQLLYSKVEGKYLYYILNKEYNYTQKDIALASGVKPGVVSEKIKEVDIELIRGFVTTRIQLDNARVILINLGYKKLGTDIRLVILK